MAVSPSEIFSVQRGIVTGFSPNTLVLFYRYHSTNAP